MKRVKIFSALLPGVGRQWIVVFPYGRGLVQTYGTWRSALSAALGEHVPGTSGDRPVETKLGTSKELSEAMRRADDVIEGVFGL